ncbi:alpha amylase N-terminal ig-like domain-containing protein [Mycoplasma capricolum]|uniref:alpha amylase N-terminal ig-like domain-containing protein n=1 Tax=Mycoplasma capricolum TaxID=2095 RepID=UPI003DA26278
MAYCYDKDRIHIILRSKKNNLKEVIFHCSEPFEPTVVIETNNYDLNLKKYLWKKLDQLKFMIIDLFQLNHHLNVYLIFLN